MEPKSISGGGETGGCRKGAAEEEPKKRLAKEAEAKRAARKGAAGGGSRKSAISQGSGGETGGCRKGAAGGGSRKSGLAKEAESKRAAKKKNNGEYLSLLQEKANKNRLENEARKQEDLAEQIRRFMEARPLSDKEFSRDIKNIELNEDKDQELSDDSEYLPERKRQSEESIKNSASLEDKGRSKLKKRFFRTKNLKKKSWLREQLDREKRQAGGAGKGASGGGSRKGTFSQGSGDETGGGRKDATGGGGF